MQKKRLSTILKKASRLLKVPILVARLRKSINIQRIISLKKSRKMKKFMLLKHYNYGYVHEYQFSPSNSPLLHRFYKREAKKRRYYEDFESIFPSGNLIKAPEREYRGHPLMELRALPCFESSITGELCHETSEMSGEDDCDDSIDERAEKLIERFYEEIRMQRQESLKLQFNPFLLDMDY